MIRLHSNCVDLNSRHRYLSDDTKIYCMHCWLISVIRVEIFFADFTCKMSADSMQFVQAVCNACAIWITIELSCAIWITIELSFHLLLNYSACNQTPWSTVVCSACTQTVHMDFHNPILPVQDTNFQEACFWFPKIILCLLFSKFTVNSSLPVVGSPAVRSIECKF